MNLTAPNSSHLGFIFLLLALAPWQAQVLTHRPVVGGVSDTTARIFLGTDKATTVAVRWSVGDRRRSSRRKLFPKNP